MTNVYKQVIKSMVYVLCLAGNCFAQTLPAVQEGLKNYSQTTLQEKVFVHTDRATYMTGEIIWFKLYTVNAATNKPLNMSKVGYVEVLDAKQNAILQAKITMKDGSGDGSFYVPVTVGNGNYRLRAYTNWMKNFSPAYYFEKTITIINPQIIPAAPAKNKADDDVRFFPEGGNLVAGLPCNVAFKATGTDGKGVDVKGAVIDQKNDTVARFASLKFGMGHFMFTPVLGYTYKAVIRTNGGKPTVRELPAIAASGYTMQLTNNNTGQLNISVNSGNSTSETVYIFAHSRQQIKAVKEAILTNGLAQFQLDKSQLDEGISHITIFNGSKQPVCERLYFKKPAASLIINSAPGMPQYGYRKKVNIPVSAKGISGKPLNADVSMSVYRLDGLQPADAGDDILSYLWLSSDLQGNVESPGYYFTNNTAEADEAADNLMLTQGWRRFEWANVLNNKMPAFSYVPEIHGHIVSATIADNATNTPAKGMLAYLAVPGKRVQLFAAKSDSLGRLLFNTKNLYGTELVAQTNTLRDSTYHINISSPFSGQFSQTVLPPFRPKPDMLEAIEARNVEMQVQNIYAADKIRQFYNPLSDSLGFYTSPVKTYPLDNYTRFTTMEEVLREYIREVNVVRTKNKFRIRFIGEKSFLYDPIALVDGIPLFDGDKVMAIDPLLIKRLEVIPQRYFYGPATLEGILSYTSYKGNQAGVEIDPHAIVVDYEGLQMQRVFYSPVYDTDNQVNSRVPDYRNLLFWSPGVKANGTDPVSFYTSDQPGVYVGILQGITANGEAGSAQFTFTVKP
nr:hypothetical protein [uncultured Mucilaginibacter sp.]